MTLRNKKIRETISKRGRFTMIPNELWESKVSPYARIVWCYLVSKQEDWDMSRNNLSRNLNIGREKVTEALQELADTGMIYIESKPGLPFIIEVNWCDSWDFSNTSDSVNPVTEDGEGGRAYGLGDITPSSALRPPVVVPYDYTKEERIDRKKEEKFSQEEKKPSVDQIRRSWEVASIPTDSLPAQQDRLNLLRDLMTTLRHYGYSESDLSRDFSEKCTAHWWIKAKKKDQRESLKARSLEDYDRALADLDDPILLIEAAEMSKKAPKKSKSSSSSQKDTDIKAQERETINKSLAILENIMENHYEETEEYLRWYDEMVAKSEEGSDE